MDHLRIARDDLQLVRLIGAGSFGQVHECLWNGKGGGLKVAVKFLNVTQVDAQAREEFLHEVQVMRYVKFTSDSIF